MKKPLKPSLQGLFLFVKNLKKDLQKVQLHEV